MLGQLTAQFAIVRVPEHRCFRNLLLARLISALGTWTAFFAVRIALYNQTNSAWWVSILLFCELVPGVDPRDRGRAADRPLAAQADDDPVRPRRRRVLRRCSRSSTPRPGSAPSRPWPASRPRSSARRATRRSRISSREDSLVAANALMQGAENLATLIGPVLAGVGIVAARLEHACTRSTRSASSSPRCLLVRIGSRLQSSVVGPDRPHALARGSRRALARPRRPPPLVDLPDLELGDARLRRHQRGGDRAHDRRVRRRQRRLRRLRRLLGRRAS